MHAHYAPLPLAISRLALISVSIHIIYIYINMYTHTYIYIPLSLSLSPPMNRYLCISMYILSQIYRCLKSISMHMSIYIVHVPMLKTNARWNKPKIPNMIRSNVYNWRAPHIFLRNKPADTFILWVNYFGSVGSWVISLCLTPLAVDGIGPGGRFVFPSWLKFGHRDLGFQIETIPVVNCLLLGTPNSWCI